MPLGLTVAALLGGCTSAPPTSLPHGVSVKIFQNRDDYGPRRMEIEVSNRSRDDITIDTARLVSRRFTSPAVMATGATILSGTATDLRVQLGETDCEADAAASASVRLTFTLPDGTKGTATVTPTDPFGAIATIAAQDCAEQLTEKTVGIALGGSVRTEQRDGHPIALLDVTFTPTDGADPVTVTQIGRTILLRPADGTDTWPVGATFTAASAPLTKTLAVVPANCRLHTVTEDKRGTYLPFTVTTSAGTGLFYLASSNAVKEQFYAYIANYCGWDKNTPTD